MFCNLAYTVGAHQPLDPAANVYDNDPDGESNRVVQGTTRKPVR